MKRHQGLVPRSSSHIFTKCCGDVLLLLSQYRTSGAPIFKAPLLINLSRCSRRLVPCSAFHFPDFASPEAYLSSVPREVWNKMMQHFPRPRAFQVARLHVFHSKSTTPCSIEGTCCSLSLSMELKIQLRCTFFQGIQFASIHSHSLSSQFSTRPTFPHIVPHRNSVASHANEE